MKKVYFQSERIAVQQGNGSRGERDPQSQGSMELPLSFRTGNHQLPSISFTAQPPTGLTIPPKEKEHSKKVYAMKEKEGEKL
jgi:hypothetical protein